MPKQYKYDFWLELGGDDMSSWHRHNRFLSADSLQTFGDTLDELVENACICTADQDGGEGPQVALTDMSDSQIKMYTASIKDAMDRADDKRGAE